ncbi:MAG: rod-binding protein [Candidatus Magnetobacterium sp. LHC-1]|uniref:Rod-binding protein n=1 Tax=Candidatus Magnetobacterium casense TaxID=1455061 RepID=A0ABS6RW80_9BACT|nr:rod-binding protein [Candidatus Magnetobacterium casensis]MBF0606435.1 rod-binding protein [Nitrospirota bacterium]MBV6340523.1 rod-binding protein [Candidatus Magnetobacterium casensis]
MKTVNGLSANPMTALRNIKGKKDPEAIKEIAREMEALFAEQMVKAMRSACGPVVGKGLGAEMYVNLFDTEIARLMSQRGLGLQDTFVEQLNRLNEESGSKQKPATKDSGDSPQEKGSLKKSGVSTDSKL